jgi:hypothetical protein
LRRTDASVEGFLARVPDERRREDDVDRDALSELINRSVRVRKGIDQAAT